MSRLRRRRASLRRCSRPCELNTRCSRPSSLPPTGRASGDTHHRSDRRQVNSVSLTCLEHALRMESCRAVRIWGLGAERRHKPACRCAVCPSAVMSSMSTQSEARSRYETAAASDNDVCGSHDNGRTTATGYTPRQGLAWPMRRSAASAIRQHGWCGSASRVRCAGLRPPLTPTHTTIARSARSPAIEKQQRIA